MSTLQSNTSTKDEKSDKVQDNRSLKTQKQDLVFYQTMEEDKNKLYREVSGAREPGIFWPSYIYYWFYSKEKSTYNALKLRQKVGREITQDEVNDYNTVRAKLSPAPRYVFSKVRRTMNWNGIYAPIDIIELKRPKNYFYPLLGVGTFSYYYLHLSRYWFLVCFTPLFVRIIYDYKFKPVEEHENFYSYILAKRESERRYLESKSLFDQRIETSPVLKRAKIELDSTGITVEQAMRDLYESYWKIAEKESEIMDIKAKNEVKV